MWNKQHNSKLEVEPELKILQDHLLSDCLCTLPQNASPTLLRRYFSATVLHSDQIASWSLDQILTHITCVRLICEKTLSQSTNTYRCRTLADLFTDLTRRQSDLIKYMLELGDDADQYIRFAAARALALFFVVLKTRLDKTWLDKLADDIRRRSHPHRMLFSLDILKCLIEWKDFEEHILYEEEPPSPPPSTCHILSMHVERIDTTHVKCLCVESLATKWRLIVNQFATLIRDQNNSSTSTVVSYQPCVILFLNLWEAIISVKANLSIIDTKPFYCSLDASVSLLSNNTSAVIWKHLLSLFNEVLCYGSTLALQHDLAGEPCSLAHVIVRNVKDRRLLRTVPTIVGNASFGGSNNSSSSSNNNKGDKILLKKIVLMVLKSVAVMVKEAKYDSSSDSSIDSQPEDDDRDMDMICRSIHDVLKKLDTFVKENEDFLPSTRLASWIVHLFMDQDDYLIESMVCCVDVARVLCYRNNFLPELRKDLNPSETFLAFTNATSFNAELLVDYLKSNETCFLLYILNFLKYLRDHWGEFVNTCRYQLQTVSKLITDLRCTIEREVRHNQIGYNINPVLALLMDCEQRFRAGP